MEASRHLHHQTLSSLEFLQTERRSELRRINQTICSSTLNRERPFLWPSETKSSTLQVKTATENSLFNLVICLGPATIRMVGHSGVNSPLPLHVPRGHSISQIVDEKVI